MAKVLVSKLVFWYFCLLFVSVTWILKKYFCIPLYYTFTYYPWLVLFRLYKTSIIWQLITLAVIKVCSETPFSKKSYHIEVGHLICKAISTLVSVVYEFSLKGISEQTLVQVFFNDLLIFNEVVLIPWKYLTFWHYTVLVKKFQVKSPLWSWMLYKLLCIF